MVKILMHGCNGKMGRMITEIVKNEEDAVIAAGVDKFTGIFGQRGANDLAEICNFAEASCYICLAFPVKP